MKWVAVCNIVSCGDFTNIVDDTPVPMSICQWPIDTSTTSWVHRTKN